MQSSEDIIKYELLETVNECILLNSLHHQLISSTTVCCVQHMVCSG